MASKAKAPIQTNPYLMQKYQGMPLPAGVFIGASSWTHEFWKGQIYHRQYKSEKDFKLLSLQEYAEFGLFNIVEIDSSFYTPPKSEVLQRYKELVPAGFLFTAKVWERISIPVFPSMKRYGKFAGLENPSFLDPVVFNQEFLPPFVQSGFMEVCASFLLQFPRMDLMFARSKLFLQNLESFFEALPFGVRLAIEVRNPEILTAQYATLLNKYKIAHCFNQWYPMPTVKEQMKAFAVAGGLEAPFNMMRLLTPRGVKYDEAGTLFEPFYQISRRDDETRQDILRFIRRSLQKEVPAYVIVNNRFEGNTPSTVQEVKGLLSQQSLIE